MHDSIINSPDNFLELIPKNISIVAPGAGMGTDEMLELLPLILKKIFFIIILEYIEIKLQKNNY